MRAELEQLVRIEGSPATIADMNTMLDWLALPDPRLLFKIVTKIFGEVSLLQNLASICWPPTLLAPQLAPHFLEAGIKTLPGHPGP
jgi:hypothetical protein